MARMKARGRSDRALSKARIVEAALDTLEARGYAGTTARAIGQTGGFNQALIYYHFESLEALLLAALREFSQKRLDRYRVELAGVTSMTELVETMTRLYEDDNRSGRLAAAQEVVSGSSSSPA